MNSEERSNEELRALCDAATPGPWAVDETPGFEHHVRTGGTSCAIPSTGEPIADAALDADAQFIAAARTAVPSLLARIAAVEALADKWERDAGRESKAWTVFGPQNVSVPFAVEQIRAALAASPTPTGPEPAKCGHGHTGWHRTKLGAGFDSCPGPATPEPTEETP